MKQTLTRNLPLAFLFFLTTLTSLTIPSAKGGVMVGVFGVGSVSSLDDPSAPSTYTNSPLLGLGGGGQLEWRLSRYFGLEGGLIYLGRKISVTDATVPTSADYLYHYLQAPFQMRLWIKNFFSLGLGGYYSFGVGQVSTSVGGLSVSSTYAALNTKGYDYGLIGSVGFNFPLGSWVAVLAEGRFVYGLCDINTPPNPAGYTKWRDIQAILGFRFGSMK